MTKDDYIKEYIKCAQDPVYFMVNYVKIAHPMKGIIPFDLYDFQKELLPQFNDNRYNIILKSRQMGISTIIAGYALWLTNFYENKNILVIATKQSVAKNLMDKYKTAYEALPTFLKRKSVENNKLTIRLSNGSFIKASSSAGDAGRSEALSLLVIDECAFINNVSEIWTSAQSTITTGGKAILLSTPNGINNFFHKMWEGAPNNGFNKISLKWDLHPERNEDWRREQDEILGEKQAAQECDCVGHDTIVSIVNDNLQEHRDIKIGDLYKLMNEEKNGIRYNSNYKILTPNGYENFTGIRKLSKTSFITLEFANTKDLVCTEDHKVILSNGKEVFVKDLKIHDKLKSFHSTEVEVIGKKEKSNHNIVVYDIIDSGKDHLYYTNNIISHNCEFLSSGNTVIPLQTVYSLKSKYVQQPIQRITEEDTLWIWKHPEENRRYVISADAARGDGADYSTFHILDVDTMEQVGEYKHKIGPKDFGKLLYSIGLQYNDALIVVENMSIGWTVLQELIDRRYPNIYYSYKNDPYFDVNVHLKEKRYDVIDKSKVVPGFTTTKMIRPILIEQLEEFIRTDELKIRSTRFYEELSTFIWHQGKAQAMRGYNDDLIMAYVIGLWVRSTAIRVLEGGKKISKQIMDNVSKVYTQVEDDDPYSMDIHIDNYNTEHEDIRWLLGNRPTNKPKENDNDNKKVKYTGIYIG